MATKIEKVKLWVWKTFIRNSSANTAAVRRTVTRSTARKGHNPSCGDEITLHLDIADGIVKDASFEGVGCAISQASTDMMIDLIRGKSVEKARELAGKFIGMIKREITDEDELEELDEALALKNVSNMPARVKCAVLAWHTLDDALKEKK